MRFSKSIPGLPALLTAAVLAVSWPVAAEAQSGSLLGSSQVPSESRDKPPKAPLAAPRTPVQTTKKTPVVPPHGPTHAQKPASPAKPAEPAKVATPAKPAQVTAPVPAVPSPQAVPDPDTKGAAAEKLPDPEKPEGTASKLPRFASLRSDEVNMRAGPGARYRIDWVYRRRDLPVEIEREFDVWRWVVDADGVHGWVHQATLMGRRSFIVQKSDATLRSDASDTASAVAILKPGVVGRIRSCEAGSDWCNVSTGSYRGYLRRSQFWGLLPGEAITP